MDQAEEKQAKKQNKKKFFKAALIWYLALAIAAVAATVGWFAMNTEVEIVGDANDIRMAVDSGDLKISLDDDKYESGIRVSKKDSPTKYKIDISGDGEKLYFPRTLNENDEPNLSTISNFVDVTGNNDYYVDLKVYFQTTQKMDVYLSSESKVEGAELLKNNTGSDKDYMRKSMYASDKTSGIDSQIGMFSCDAIVGAARVAFLEVVGQDEKGNDILELKNVWIPNDQLHLYYTVVENEPKAVLNINDRSASERNDGPNGSWNRYSFLMKSPAGEYMIVQPYSSDDYAHYAPQGGDTKHFISLTDGNSGSYQLADLTENLANHAVPLLQFAEEGELQTKELVIRIWFEGTDREADKACNGGMATYDLHFIGISKNDAKTLVDGADSGTPYDDNTDGIWFDTESDKLKHTNGDEVKAGELIYSLNGIEWSDYVSNTPENVFKNRTTDMTIYVRLKEGKETKASNVVKVLIPKKETEPQETN